MRMCHVSFACVNANAADLRRTIHTQAPVKACCAMPLERNCRLCDHGDYALVFLWSGLPALNTVQQPGSAIHIHASTRSSIGLQEPLGSLPSYISYLSATQHA
eukprot:jgi/Ulvmu1/11829/UM080_0040.1